MKNFSTFLSFMLIVLLLNCSSDFFEQSKNNLYQNRMKSAKFFIDSSNPDIEFLTIPPYSEFQWAQTDAILMWEVQGGETWTLWRNGTKIHSNEKISNIIEIRIENWQQEEWRLGFYNLTLEIKEGTSTSVNGSMIVRIKLDIGDEYANSVIRSLSLNYFLSENAIGAPDRVNSSIYSDYGDGILVLDMGINEEIINGAGNDFNIISEGGNYTVMGGNEIGSPFTFIAQSQGNGSFDLSAAGLEMARYIHIQCASVEEVELDSIMALNYNVPDGDYNSPFIEEHSDFWIWENQTTITLSWIIDDLTPWNYSISVNEALYQSGPWNGSEIVFDYNWTVLGNISVHFECYDLFRNYAHELIIIEIKSIESNSGEKNISGFQIAILLPIIMLSELFYIFLKKKDLTN